jgi:hypothetical protein
MALPPINLPVPAETKAIYITAISLYQEYSEVSVSWADGSEEEGAQFVGPSKSYVLGDKVFQLPVIVIDGNELPKELVISVRFKDSLEHQISIVGPISKKVGPEGDATEVQVSYLEAGFTFSFVFRAFRHDFTPHAFIIWTGILIRKFWVDIWLRTWG